MWSLLMRLRRWWYRRGHRPKPGTVLYSPSMDMIYAWREAHPEIVKAWGVSRNREE